MTKTKKFPEPNILTRKDRPTLQWSAEECAPKRGVARTDIIGRRIFAPVGDTPLERVVRAHEMMHAKITPAEDLNKWIERGVATFEAMQAVEEIRVNYGIEIAGFDLDELTDGNEDADGEYAVIHGEWRKAVLFAVATAGTSGGKRFLVGVRRHNRTWADALAKIQKHLWKQIIGAHTGKIGRKRVFREDIFSTEVDTRNGLYPMGFGWTERWAEYVDRLGELPPKENDKGKGKDKGKSKSKSEEGGDEDGDEAGGDAGDETEGESEISDKGTESYGETLRRMRPLKVQRGSDVWGKLVWGKVPLTNVSKGRLGKRRVAMPYGRNPRRIGRLYTDPQRRVFDHERRAKGGIVLIDGSGSMSLTRENVLDILKVAPGATVAIYSDMDEGERNIPNIHIIAKDGKCVDAKNMPAFGAGNGVDLPALEWAIKERKSKKTPIVWVTDGGVCVPNGGWDDMLATVCMKTAKKNSVVCVDHVDSAIKQLQALNMGKTVSVKYPNYFRQVIERIGGMDDEQVVTTK